MAQVTASSMADLGLAGAAQRTRFMVSSTAVSFRANLFATVQAHVEAMRIPEDGPAAPHESRLVRKCHDEYFLLPSRPVY